MIERTDEDIATTVAELAPRLGRPVHAFSFRGVRFVYFLRTGDLVRVNEAAFRALSAVERGEPVPAIRALLAREFGAEVAQAVAADLAVLGERGYLRPDVQLSSGDREQDLQALLRHSPRNLMFFVTEACNLACTYCYELGQGVHARAATLKQVDARRIIDRYFEGTRREAVTITFFGGEPLLNFKVVRDSVEYAKRRAGELSKQVDFTMTTNLTLLTEEIADFLAEHRFHVMVSLDGDREGNDRHRRTVAGEGTYDTVIGNLRLLIKKLRAAGVRLPKLRATMTAGNSDSLAVEEHLLSLGTPLVEVGDSHGTVAGGLRGHDVNHAQAEAGRVRIDTVIHDYVAKLESDPTTMPELPRALVKSLVRVHQEVTRGDERTAARPKLCGVCRNMKAVTPNGDLYPCHRYVGMESFRMGNMHTGGIDRAREHEYYDRIYDAFDAACASCWARHLCGGQCPWYLSAPDGSILPPDEATCDLLRAGFESHLGLYGILLDRFPDAFRALLSEEAEAIRGEAGGLAPDPACGT